MLRQRDFVLQAVQGNAPALKYVDWAKILPTSALRDRTGEKDEAFKRAFVLEAALENYKVHRVGTAGRRQLCLSVEWPVSEGRRLVGEFKSAGSTALQSTPS